MKKAQLSTNIHTYFIVIFIFLVFVVGLMYLASETLANDNANLDNDSLSYISNLTGIDTSIYDPDSDFLEDPILSNANYSQGNPKDEALDFQYAKEKGVKIENIIKNVLTLPTTVLIDIMRLPLNDWAWIINIIVWFLGFTILIAIIYFVRNNIDK